MRPLAKIGGNGNKPESNLYWGAMYGIKTYFKKSPDWNLISSKKVDDIILERLVFKHKEKDIILIADAYRGGEMKTCLSDFFKSAAGAFKAKFGKIECGGKADLIVFAGHNGLMDFKLPEIKGKGGKDVMAFCCKSKPFFRNRVTAAGSRPVLLTNGVMAPEAYCIKAAIDSWMNGGSDVKIARQAAVLYNRYQKCGIRGAYNLFKP